MTQYAVDVWTVADGLPHSSVHAIARLPDGPMWLATEAGLARFDGARFTTYDAARVPGLGASLVDHLAIDSAGRLLVGGPAGLMVLEAAATHSPEPSEITVIGVAEGLSAERITGLAAAPDGSVWISTGVGIDRWQGGRIETVAALPTLPGSAHPMTPHALAVSSDGVLWVGTDTGLLRYGSVIHEARSTVSPVAVELPDPRVRALLPSADGSIWVGTLGGLARLARPSTATQAWAVDAVWTVADGLAHSWIEGLAEDSDGNLWIATGGGGLSRLSTSGEIDSLTPEDGLPGRFLRDLHFDNEGGLWISTFGAGLLHFQTPRLTTWGEREGLHDSVASLIEDREGNLLIGTFGDGLWRFDGHDVGTLTHLAGRSTGLSSDRIWSIAETSDGTLWIGTLGDGLNRLTPDGQVSVLRAAEGLAGEFVRVLRASPEGTLWIGTTTGLQRWRGGRLENVEPVDVPELATADIQCILVRVSGDVWVGTAHLGLIRLWQDAEGELAGRRFGEADGLPGKMVYSLHEDANAAVWVGTGDRGLARVVLTELGEPQVTTIRSHHGLPSDTVYAVLEDTQENLWLSTAKGIAGLPRRVLEEAATGGLGILEPVTYGPSDGLRSAEAMRGLRATDGRLWWTTVSGGLSVVDPLVPHAAPPTVRFEDVRYRGDPLPISAPDTSSFPTVVVPPGSAQLAVRWTSSDLRDPRRLRFSYRLGGQGASWVDAGPARLVYFHRLPPGTYSLEVRARLGGGQLSQQPARLDITVRPPWWRTGWAFGCCALLGLAGVILHTRFQEARLRRAHELNTRLRAAERMKDELLANTSHELRTPLYGIVGMAEALADDAAAGGVLAEREGAQASLESIIASGKRLAGLIDDLLDLSKLSRDRLELELRVVNLRSVAEIAVARYRSRVSEMPIELVNAVPEDLPTALADPQRLRQILGNLLKNAIAFTSAGRIEVSAEHLGEHLSVRVVDTGSGIADADLGRIFEPFEQADGSTERAHGGVGLGLTLAQRLVELHGGTIHAEAGVETGTAFVFTVPVSGQAASVPVLGEATKLPPTSTQNDRPADLVVEGDGAEEDFLAAQRALAASSASASATSAPPASQPSTSPASTSSTSPTSSTTTLPAKRKPPRPSPEESRQGSRMTMPEGQFRILLVDDETMVRMVLAQHLLAEGLELIEAASGEEALAILERESVDLVLLDIMMPRMSGYTVCRFLRQTYSLTELPVIFLTARSEQRDRVEGFLAGANDYLTKPISRSELLLRVRTHLEILVQHRELLHVTRQLETRNADLERFADTLAHELRNPLVTIQGFLGMLSREVSTFDSAPEANARLERHVGRIDGAARQMARLVDELLEISQVHGVRPESDEIPLAEVAREALGSCRARLERRGVEVEIADAMPAVVAERRRLVEIYENLIDNAAKFIGAADPPRLEIGARREDGHVVAWVRDNGVGIDPRYHDKIFELFRQLDPAAEGNGLGLALVKRLVELHGGAVWVESDGWGCGATFTFSLPMSSGLPPRGR